MPREIFNTSVTYTDPDGAEQSDTAALGSTPAVLNMVRAKLHEGATDLTLNVTREAVTTPDPPPDPADG